MQKKLAKKSGNISIMIVDDHPIVREGLSQLIERDRKLTICAEAEDAAGALEVLERQRPDVIILDISLKKGSGLDLIKVISNRFPEIKIIVLSMHDAMQYAERALRAGALGYIMKQQANEKVLEGIYKIMEGKIFVTDKIANRLLQKQVGSRSYAGNSEMHQLSDRELEVFQFIGQGYGTRQIAETLSLSIKTVETYREHIKEKLKLANATELVHRAAQWVQAENIKSE